MVALHNKKLSMRDVFPDCPWEEESINIKRRAFEELRREAGQTHPEAVLGAAEDVRLWLNDLPSMRTRQEAMARAYPVNHKSGLFTEEEISYLLNRLDGVNELVGQQIIKKLEKLSKC